MPNPTVYVLVYLSNGEASTSVFRTHAARDRAVLTEALSRHQQADEEGHDLTDWPIRRVALEPENFIMDITFGEVDVKTDDVELEG